MERCRQEYWRSVKVWILSVSLERSSLGVSPEISDVYKRQELERELQMIDTNIKALHILTKLYLRDFLKRDRGYILNVASSAAFVPGPLLSSYYASKAYVLRLSEGIQEEIRRKNSRVSVTVLCPGPVNTEFNQVAKVKFAVPGLSSERVAQYGVQEMFRRKDIACLLYTSRCV